jgi:hypothetical protein
MMEKKQDVTHTSCPMLYGKVSCSPSLYSTAKLSKNGMLIPKMDLKIAKKHTISCIYLTTQVVNFLEILDRSKKFSMIRYD